MSVDPLTLTVAAALLAAIRGQRGPGAMAAALGELSPSLEFARQILGAPNWETVPFTALPQPVKILSATAARRRIVVFNLSTQLITIAPGAGLLPKTGIRINPAEYKFSGQPAAVIGTSPGAGNDISFTIPTTSIAQRIRGLAAQLTTGAVAGNRVPDLQLNLLIPGVGFAPIRLAGSQAIGPNLNQFYYWIPGAPNVTNSNASPPGTPQANQFLPPDLVLIGGSQILTVTTGLGGTDSWGTPILWVEELVQTGAGGMFDDSGLGVHGGEWWATAPVAAAGLVAELKG